MQGSEALTRIMYALLQHRPDMSYSRPLHQLAAFILVVMGTKNEQQAFWTLLGTIHNKLFPEVKGEVSEQQSTRVALVAPRHSCGGSVVLLDAP